MNFFRIINLVYWDQRDVRSFVGSGWGRIDWLVGFANGPTKSLEGFKQLKCQITSKQVDFKRTCNVFKIKGMNFKLNYPF
jgi:hypothetical protein